MTRDERIEAVARAIYLADADRESDYSDDEWGSAPPDVREWYLYAARKALFAALQSLLEPSEAMVKAGSHPINGWDERFECADVPAEEALRAMIQQAIKEME